MSLELSSKALAVKPSSTLAITAKAKEMKAQGIDVVGFGAGEPDFPTHANICDAAKKALDEGFTKYTPAAGTVELRKAVAEKFEKFNHLHYDYTQIIITNGGKGSLTEAFEALINPGDEVIIPAPYWLSYPELIKLCDGVPVYVYAEKSNGFKVTAAQIEAAVTEKTKAIVLNTPNNPTGSVYSEEELRAIAEVAVKHDFYVIADEMYEYLIYNGKPHVSIASFGEEIYNRTITCSGLSKSYAMTGWRVGYLGAPAHVAKAIGAIQSHQASNVNSIAQKAALEALAGPQDSVEAMIKEFAKRRDYMVETISAMPHVELSNPEGAFYAFVDCSEALELSFQNEKIETTTKLANILLNDFHVAVVPCPDFGFSNYIRLSYALSLDDIKKGLARISDFLQELN